MRKRDLNPGLSDLETQSLLPHKGSENTGVYLSLSKTPEGRDATAQLKKQMDGKKYANLFRDTWDVCDKVDTESRVSASVSRFECSASPCAVAFTPPVSIH